MFVDKTPHPVLHSVPQPCFCLVLFIPNSVVCQDAGPSPMVVTEGEPRFWSASHATCMRILKMLHFAQSSRRCFSLFATAVLMDGRKWRFTRSRSGFSKKSTEAARYLQTRRVCDMKLRPRRNDTARAPQTTYFMTSNLTTVEIVHCPFNDAIQH